MSRRLRAGLFAASALLCAVGSAALASRYGTKPELDYGDPRPVVVVERPLAKGSTLRRRDLASSLGRAELPQRLLPPDALGDPREALGRSPANEIPAGSYLLTSQLRAQTSPRPRAPAPGRLPVEVTVAGAGSLSGAGASSISAVDVVVAEEPGARGRPRVRLAARGVPLLELRRAGAAGGERGGWIATLGLRRPQALELIEAENYAREVRLIPRPPT